MKTGSKQENAIGIGVDMRCANCGHAPESHHAGTGQCYRCDASNRCPVWIRRDSGTQGFAVRASVRWFAEQMELALRRNDHKGGWHECEPMWLVQRISQEQKELREACEHHVPPDCGCREAGCPHTRIFAPDEADIIKEAADVAALAMMVADHFRFDGPSQDQGHTLCVKDKP